MRRRRAFERLSKKGINIEEYQQARAKKEEARRRTIEYYLWPYINGVWKHKLEIRLVMKGTPEFEQSFEESFKLYCKYQQTIHQDREYTRHGYENFLVNTPLIMEDNVSGEPGLGSYHQQYLIDGRIVAVGVIDILPHCLSSKYFYYDPEFNFLTLGTYSALREIWFTKELSKSRPELHYYYMGYFLINCPKMRYKGRFRPSDLLCDQSYQWVPLSECEPMILANDGKFTVFRPEIPRPPLPDIQTVKCVFKSTVMTYADFREYLEDQEEWDQRLTEYVRYSGFLAQRVLLSL
uniref:N-end rule aminoacyl transferase C-terminal domain-containing protein n=1 Tax=Acrobeloides nanus TaxID=290746 RepID=A0A914EKB7_9BILA